MLQKIADWLNAQLEAEEGTNGDALRALIENMFKAIVNLLNAIGEWPIEV